MSETQRSADLKAELAAMGFEAEAVGALEPAGQFYNGGTEDRPRWVQLSAAAASAMPARAVTLYRLRGAA